MPRHRPEHTSRSRKPNQKSAQAAEGESQFLDSVRADPSLVHLDGRTLEGGGQLVRLALALSALARVPIHVHRIRGNRSGHSSRDGGGLKSSHLAAFDFLANATGAKTWGGHVGSTEIVFEAGGGVEQVIREGVRRNERLDRSENVHEIRLQKPGCVWLIFQAILPYILFAAPDHHSVLLIMSGGTNVPMSMSGEYVKQVMCPMFEKIGLPRVQVDIEARGWTHGRAIQIGRVLIRVHPLKMGAKIPAFELKERGAISKIAISVLAGSEAMRMALIEQATRQVHDRYPQLQPAEVAVDEDSGDPKRLYLLLVAHTTNGCRLGRDWLYHEKIQGAPSKSQAELIAEKVVDKVIGELALEIAHGGCVDEYMRDQLVVFETLADGKSHVDGGLNTGEGSLHTKTCRWVAEQILADQAHFDAAGHCTGVGFSAGEIYEDRKGVETKIMRRNDESHREETADLGNIKDSDQEADNEIAEKLEAAHIV